LREAIAIGIPKTINPPLANLLLWFVIDLVRLFSDGAE
jgi:hypothetical protein